MLRRRKPRTVACAWAVSLIVLCSTGPAGAGNNAFTLIGPDGGSVRTVVLHPTMPAIAYALTSGGFYRSTDAGLNWQIVNADLHFPPEDLAVDPREPNRVLLAAIGQSPLVSTDAGGSSSLLWLLALGALSYARPRRFNTSGGGPSKVAVATLPTNFRSFMPTGVV